MNDIKFNDPVEIYTKNCGQIQCEREDLNIIQHIDKLASEAWQKNNAFSGFEYFRDIADACQIDYITFDVDPEYAVPVTDTDEVYVYPNFEWSQIED